MGEIALIFVGITLAIAFENSNERRPKARTRVLQETRTARNGLFRNPCGIPSSSVSYALWMDLPKGGPAIPSATTTPYGGAVNWTPDEMLSRLDPPDLMVVSRDTAPRALVGLKRFNSIIYLNELKPLVGETEGLIAMLTPASVR